MVIMCRRLLPAAEERDIYLQGGSSFKLPKGHLAVSVYCSPHNPGARELAEELNSIWPGLLQMVDVQSWSGVRSCDHMLVYLNAQTWAHDPETFAAELREAMRQGVHLQPCHEFPSAIDSGSERQALEFKQIMDMTPADLKKWPTNLYSQIAIAVKGGELREPGLANLAQRLAHRSKAATKLARQNSSARLSLNTSAAHWLSGRQVRTRKVSTNANVGSIAPGEIDAVLTSHAGPSRAASGLFGRLPTLGRVASGFSLRTESNRANDDTAPATSATTGNASTIESST